MLIIGESKIIDIVEPLNVRILNLSSLKEGYEKLNLLPLQNIVYEDEKQFDYDYGNFIMQNDHVFVELFKVIKELYEGKHVFIMVNKTDELETITESLTKFIQQRYGYNAIYVNDTEDLENINDTTDFSLLGLYNLDIDKERYTELTFRG